MKVFAVPKTLTGQVSLLIGVSLVLAHVLGIAAMYFIMVSNSREAAAAAFPATVVMRLASQAAAPSHMDAVLASAQRAGIQLSRIPATAMASSTSPLPSELTRQGAFSLLLEVSGLNKSPERLRLGQGPKLVLILRDGTGLAFPLPEMSEGSSVIIAPLVYVLIVLVIMMLGISLYAARSLIAPLSSIAEAATLFGRSAQGVVVEERGPTEIKQVARALNEMGGRISALLDERLGMLTAISHDLRTPLTRIRLRAEKIARVEPQSLSADGILTDVSRMEHLLTEALTYMRDSTHGEEIVPVDLPSMVETICSELSDLGKEVSYSGPSRLVLHCQPTALTRAISNLIDNGLKFGTSVTVSVITGETGTVQIKVADNGVGIPAALHERVFEPFFKADAARTSNERSGFGLGLSIARNFVKAQGGELAIQSNVPQGTIATITLPLQAQMAASARAELKREACLPAN